LAKSDSNHCNGIVYVEDIGCNGRYRFWLALGIIGLNMVKQVLVVIECKLESTREITNDNGKYATTVVFGRIVKYHIHSSVLGGTEEKPVVDLEKIRLCGRVGGITYWPAGEGKALSMKRP